MEAAADKGRTQAKQPRSLPEPEPPRSLGSTQVRGWGPLPPTPSLHCSLLKTPRTFPLQGPLLGEQIRESPPPHHSPHRRPGEPAGARVRPTDGTGVSVRLVGLGRSGVLSSTEVSGSGGSDWLDGWMTRWAQGVRILGMCGSWRPLGEGAGGFPGKL